jgi:glycosyltransferase involved in cell wall biosynthesis
MSNGATIKPSLLVFADDWGRHPSSCQHLVAKLASKYQVWWINTIGMRPPRLDHTTLIRGIGKLHCWTRAKDHGLHTGNPIVMNPWMWPWIRRRFDRRLNRTLLRRQLEPILRSMSAPPVAITTLPITADIMDCLPVRHWVYYCVDNFAKWPLLENRTLEQMEADVVRRSARLIAASENLRDRLLQMGRPAHLLMHGVDLDHWRTSDREGLAALDGLERPLVVFWGLIDRRIDTEFVRQTALRMVRGTVLLAGPTQNPDPSLWKIPRVKHVPALPYHDLPRLASQAAVLIMPYVDQPVTRFMQPLKLTEYLATNKPIVARDLPANRSWSDCLDLADTPGAFAAAVSHRICEGLPAVQRLSRCRLSEESWTAKAQQFERWALRAGETAQPVVEEVAAAGL